jgi:hypothetical protein
MTATVTVPKTARRTVERRTCARYADATPIGPLVAWDVLLVC